MSNIEKVVTVDGITYIIDKTCKATAIKIASKKISKDASIKVKGVKGNTRKKLIKAINK